MLTYRESASLDWSEDSIRLIATPSNTARTTFFYVQEAGYFKTQPHYYTERENLNSYLIVYTVSGKGMLKYKNAGYTLTSGQAFFIDCMNYQYYETDKKEPWEILWVHFNGIASGGYYEQFEKSGSPIACFEKSSPVPGLIRSLLQTHQNKDIRTEPLSSKLLVELLTEFLLSAASESLSTNGQVSSESFLPDYIKAMMKDIDKRFSEKLTLDELAHKYAVSKFHLAREFKAYTGFSPNEYIINARITYAKELLKYSDSPVSEIAYKVGIDNVSHFINLFKDRVGKTPLAFRKEWQYIK